MAKGDGTEPRGWRFNDGSRVFRIFPELRLLLNGEERVKLRSRAFDLLVLLVKHGGKTVSKDMIVTEVWKDNSISESAVSSQVSQLRSTIGAGCIVSIASQGYVFRLPVEPIEALPPSPELRRLAITLPHPTGIGIGRDSELATLEAECARSRLVTIIGPGGVGKTWAAIELGWRLTSEFPEGVHLVDLGPVRDPAALAGTVAQALGVGLRGTDEPSRVLASLIDKQRLLLIFDSCEYIIGPARALIAALLAQAPNLTILVTSQIVLDLPDEVVLRLPPLPEADAVALFTARARAAGHRFEPDDKETAIVAEICRRLDGIPLALELAAALVPRLGIERVRSGLTDRFEMMDSRPRHGKPRQATLSAMVEWSYGLLDEDEQRLFRRLAVFNGSFTEDAAAAIAWADGTSVWKIAAGLARFVDMSLLVFIAGEPQRFRLLETIGAYNAAQLKDSGEFLTIAERHAAFYARLFERADLAWETMPDAAWTDLYGPEIDNLRVALEWAMAEPERLSIAIALAGAGAYLWERLNLSAEGRACMDRLIGLIDETVPIAEAARLLKSAGMLWLRTDRARSVALIERSIVLYRQIESGPKLGGSLGYLGGNYVFLGRYDEAKAALAEAQALLAGSDRVKSSLRVMIDLATLAQYENRFDDAKSASQAARDLAQKLKDPLREYIVINNLAVHEFLLGNIAQATEHFRDAASGFRTIAQPAYLGPVLVNLAACLTFYDADAEARMHATEALALTRVDGGSWLRLCLERWVFLAARAGQYAEAARLLGFVEAGYARSGEVRDPLSQRVYVEATRLLTTHCTTEDIRAWADDGARWSEAQAADFTVRRLTAAGT